eukprot:scaffold22619_cov149-Isochrysis_galbana.AAC.2
MRCLRPCTPPVRLFSVYSLRVQPSIRQGITAGGINHRISQFADDRQSMAPSTFAGMTTSTRNYHDKSSSNL